MKKIANFCMPSCKKASELVEKKIYFKLNLIEKMQLNLHTVICDVCKSYEKKSENMDKTLQKHILNQDGFDTSNHMLSDNFKEEITRKLDENQ